MTKLPSTLPGFLLHVVKPFRKYAFGLLGAALVYALLLNLLGPYYLKRMIDTIASAEHERALIFTLILAPAAMYVALFIAAGLNFRMADWLRLRLLPEVRQHIIVSMSAYLKRHSNRMFQDNFAGSLSNKIFDMANGAVSILIKLEEAIAGFAALALALVTMYLVHPLFAAILALWVAIFFWATMRYFPRISHLSLIYSEHRSSLVGRVVDSISNIGNIRSFARHGHEHAHLRQMAAENAGHDRALQWQVLWMRMFQDASIVLFVGAIVAALVYLYRLGMVTAGDFAMLLTVAVATFQTIWYLASQFVDFAEEWGRCRQALAVIAMPHEIVDAPGAQPLQVARGRIEFERVTFRHQRNDNLFEDKSVVIEAGQKVGLVGLSGSGKTTFANLILRLYEIQSGRILIDGQDIARVTQESLHRSIALIPQDTSLFHRSLMENIRYGRLDASDAEVIEAARRAHCDDFIGRLPEKYATLVGERGLKLSGGQRQRIAIARAILKDAPILILDEATSALDSVTESAIQDSLHDLMQDRTTIVIAHRLSTLAQMDRILVFSKGRIIEDGTHDGLLADGGQYARMWRMQAGGFLQEAA